MSKTLADPEIRPMALETMRGLIRSVTVHETSERVRIDLAGAITALVGLAQTGTAAVCGCKKRRDPFGCGVFAKFGCGSRI